MYGATFIYLFFFLAKLILPRTDWACRTELRILRKYVLIPWRLIRCTPSRHRKESSSQKPWCLQNIILGKLSICTFWRIDTLVVTTLSLQSFLKDWHIGGHNFIIVILSEGLTHWWPQLYHCNAFWRIDTLVATTLSLQSCLKDWHIGGHNFIIAILSNFRWVTKKKFSNNHNRDVESKMKEICKWKNFAGHWFTTCCIRKVISAYLYVNYVRLKNTEIVQIRAFMDQSEDCQTTLCTTM